MRKCFLDLDSYEGSRWIQCKVRYAKDFYVRLGLWQIRLFLILISWIPFTYFSHYGQVACSSNLVCELVILRISWNCRGTSDICLYCRIISRLRLFRIGCCSPKPQEQSKLAWKMKALAFLSLLPFPFSSRLHCKVAWYLYPLTFLVCCEVQWLSQGCIRRTRPSLKYMLPTICILLR